MDNRYFNNGCPPLMQDGRFITNYSFKRILDQEIRSINKINNSYDYKHFLQTYGNQIMDKERNILQQLNTCSVSCDTSLSKLQ
jgi:hypothetical protein